MSLSSLFDGRIGTFLAIFIAICVVGLAVVLVLRALRRGIKPSAGRRLGLVDAFDLDRHRQLVIIRRDNVEHLIMIGGPNDLVIESDIVRGQPAVSEGRRDPSMVASPSMAAPQAAPTPTLPTTAASVAPPVDMRPTPPMPRANPMPQPRQAPPARAPDVKAPVAEPSKAELPRMSVNIDSLEEEMTRLLGRPPEKKD